VLRSKKWIVRQDGPGRYRIKSMELAGMSTFSNPLIEYSPQMELDAAAVKEFDGESERGIFDEYQELEQAIALLEVANEEQLDRVLGVLIQKANSELGNAVSPPVGRAIAGVLKTVAGDALPLARETIGQRIGSRLGAQFGRGLASIAGPALGLELEGLSREDSEFEAIRQFVRFAAKTVENAGGIAPPHGHADVAHRAAAEAARIYAPGLTIGGRRHGGRWAPGRPDRLLGA
jgi:hypothetical protein